MNDHDIDQMLRRKPPTIQSPRSLEAKIRAQLRAETRPAPSVRWPWIIAPIAAVIALVALLQPGAQSPAPKPIVATPPPVETLVAVDAESAEELPLIARNPLSSEARALRRDAERTGRFLVNCLPSLTQAEP